MSKVCKWLDSNIWGGLQLNNGDLVSACCAQFNLDIFEGEKVQFDKLSSQKIQSGRKKLFDKINNNKQKECINCPYLVEKENIDIGQLQFLSIANFKTCNLRCKYCYYSDEELGEKLNKEKTYILPIIKNFHNENMLRDKKICIAVAGGESTLVEDLPEAVQYVADNFPYSTFNLQSNCTLTSRINKLIDPLKKIKGVHKFLYTSLDAGTPETYKQIRGKDLFYDVINNLCNYAKNNVFDTIDLKYLLLNSEDKNGEKYNNLNYKDIFGFLQIVKLISSYPNNKVIVTIDKDLFSKYEITDKEMIDYAGIIYHYCSNEFNIEVTFTGGGIAENTKQGIEAIKKIKEYAKNYETKEKTKEELFYQYLLIQKTKNICKEPMKEEKLHFIEHIFSIRNEENHKVIRIIGIKFKIKRKRGN